MKSVLISVHPKKCEKIASGEQTIIVKKSKPKIDTPFKCYIYCTKDKRLVYKFDKGEDCYGTILEKPLFVNSHCWVNDYIADQKVIGEFVCDKINCSQAYFDSQGKNHLTNVFPEDIKKTCLTEYELWNYIAGKTVKANEMYDGWLWHISDLKIYDKSKRLREFGNLCRKDCLRLGKGKSCEFLSTDGTPCNRIIALTRPPQSWCYVEEL